MTATSRGIPAGFEQVDVETDGAVAPGSPSFLTAPSEASAAGVAMYWTDDSNFETGFEVERSVDGVNFTPLVEVSADENDYIDTSAAPDSIYFYRVCAVYSSGGYTAYSNPSNTVTVNTPGVSIQVQSQQEDPAGNPEIWVDNSAMNSSTGSIDPPTSSDSNLVPVTFNVPLGADDYGTATATWSSSIRLYQSSGGTFSQVGTLSEYVPEYSMTWNVSPGLSSQTCLAQADTVSVELGDQNFAIDANLFLEAPSSDAQPNPNAQPSAAKPATNPDLKVMAKVGNSGQLAPLANTPAMVGAHVYVYAYYGPQEIFANDPKRIHWNIDTADAVDDYVVGAGSSKVFPLTDKDLSDSYTSYFYTIGAFDGRPESVTFTYTRPGGKPESSPPAAFLVYSPKANFQGTATPGLQRDLVGPYWDESGYWLHDGNTKVMINGVRHSGPPGYIVTGSAQTPNIPNDEGAIALLQLVDNYQITYYLNDPTYLSLSTNGFECDGDFPYATKDIATNSQVTIDANDDWNDSPASNLDNVYYVVRKFEAKDFVMYKWGGQGGDSIYVSLLNTSWDWSASLYRSSAATPWGQPTDVVMPTSKQMQPWYLLPQWSANAADYEPRYGNVGELPPFA
jgi:hypothetical protein